MQSTSSAKRGRSSRDKERDRDISRAHQAPLLSPEGLGLCTKNGFLPVIKSSCKPLILSVEAIYHLHVVRGDIIARQTSVTRCFRLGVDK